VAKSTLDKVLEQTEAAIPAAPAAQQMMTPAMIKQALSLTLSATMKQGEREMYALHKRLIAEPKVKVSLSPMYRPYFGNVMLVGNGGITIYFPIDGKSHDVPKSYARIIHGRRRAVDVHIMRKNRLADVQSNFETAAGELKFF
jgi:hypothetical protein